MNITVKGVPASLHERLRDAAKQNGRSLNAEILAVLERALVPTPADRRDLLVRVRELRASLGFQTDSASILDSRGEGRA
jgi:plasmid stability protein